MRNPNGYGCIVDLGKKRRNRYAVRITDKLASLIPDANGIYRQKYKYLGYYPTIKEAKQALAEYNILRTPTQYIDITFAEAWERWAKRNLTDCSSARYYSYSSAFKKCAAIHSCKMADLRLDDLNMVMDSNIGTSKSTLNNIKIVMSFVFNWAMENDVITKNYADFVKVRDYKAIENHKAFKSEEIDELWAHKSEYDIILMYIYTGCRPSELTSLCKSDVHLEDNYFYIPKSKTKAGIRYVPIADKIKPFFDHYMSLEGSNLLPLSYEDLRRYYSMHLPGHTPHDTRSTFVSLMTAAGIQEVIIQKIVGHSGGNVTRDVYTQLELKPLLDAVNVI